jgi:hypothetical protein
VRLVQFWRHLLSDAAGFAIGGTGAVKAGDSVELKLKEPAPVRAAVEVLIEGQGPGLRYPELTDALLFVELEGKRDGFPRNVVLKCQRSCLARERRTRSRFPQLLSLHQTRVLPLVPS